MKKFSQKGLTKIELIVVVVILGVLSFMTYGNFQTSVKKERDVKMKATLHEVRLALEKYYGQNKVFPPSINEGGNAGKIQACGCSPKGEPCFWGESELCDANYIVYLRTLPGEAVKTKKNFCYISEGQSFKLYADVENNRDPECLEHNLLGFCTASRECGGKKYNFGISSAGTKP